MITKTFYKSEFYNLIFLLITLIILRLPEFIYPDHLNYFYQNRSFSNSIFSNINAVFNSKLNLIISSVLLILQAFVLSYIIKKYNLTNKSSYIPEVLFLAIGSSLKAFSYLSPALICNFLLLLGTNVVFSTIKSDHQIKRLFYLGFICALGAIVYLPYIFITIAFIVSLYIIKTVYIKEPIAILIGFCTPYIMLFMLYFWVDKVHLFKDVWLNLKFAIPQTYSLDNSDYYAVIVVLLPIFIISLLQLNISNKRNYKLTKSLIVFIFAAIFSFIFSDFNNVSSLLLLSGPLSILLSLFFINTNNYYWVKETTILYILTTIIFIKISYLF